MLFKLFVKINFQNRRVHFERPCSGSDGQVSRILPQQGLSKRTLLFEGLRNIKYVLTARGAVGRSREYFPNRVSRRGPCCSKGCETSNMFLLLGERWVGLENTSPTGSLEEDPVVRRAAKHQICSYCSGSGG